MIKNFRKIRHQLISDNKIGKYLLYAIGEIILVIVGILIALAINNRNQIRQNEDKINLLLAKTQSDLLIDIIESEKKLQYWHKKDSLLNIILTRQLEEKDYRQPNGFQTAILQYENMEFSDNSYNLLVQNINIVPDR
jgi:hypothetical protein